MPDDNEHSPPGGPVHETGNRRRSGSVKRSPCGCAADDFVWLAFCDKVKRANDAHRAAVALSRDPLMT